MDTENKCLEIDTTYRIFSEERKLLQSWTCFLSKTFKRKNKVVYIVVFEKIVSTLDYLSLYNIIQESNVDDTIKIFKSIII